MGLHVTSISSLSFKARELKFYIQTPRISAQASTLHECANGWTDRRLIALTHLAQPRKEATSQPKKFPLVAFLH